MLVTLTTQPHIAPDVCSHTRCQPEQVRSLKVRTTKAVVNDLQLLKRQLVCDALAPAEHMNMLANASKTKRVANPCCGGVKKHGECAPSSQAT
jgi:hypothetical protein